MASTRIQDHQPPKKVTPDLHPIGLLAQRPIIGIIMFIFGSLLFAGMAYNLVAEGPLLQWDKLIANTLPAIALKSSVFVRGILIAGYYIGDQVILALGIMLALYFIIRRYWKELVMLACGLAGSSLLFLFLSRLFARPRPATQIWIILKIPGFPSGHSFSVVVFYGLLAYLLAPRMLTVFWKVFVVVTALLIMGFVGFSRIFTGGHYLTDVIAGYAVGIAWSSLIYTLIEVFYQKRRSRIVKGEINIPRA